MNVSINDLPPNVLFKIYQSSDASSRQALLRVNKSWNASGKCFEMINQTLNYAPSQVQLVKAGGFFIAALGKVPQKLTKLFYFQLINEKLIPKINDDRTTILNVFSTANRLLVHFKRGIKLFSCDDRNIEKIQEIKVKENHTKIRVEYLDDQSIIIRTLTGTQSEIAIFDTQSGAKLEIFTSVRLSKIKDGILVITQKNSIVKYSLTEQKILEKIDFLQLLAIALNSLQEQEDFTPDLLPINGSDSNSFPL